MNEKVKNETQISAGGAVFRETSRGLEVVLISTGDPPRWQLPKGLVEPGETAEAAAEREVREEAGISARIDQLIEKVEYWYQAEVSAKRIRYHKFVNFFLMWYRSGDVADHDNEVHEARWFPVDEATGALAFRSEQTVVQKATGLARRNPAG
jgi:8-oxo-dGTP diphosphatase